ncbi:LOW QUALITY PROTEIN: putative FBD-associated F-box protein At1g61330 [Rutidosis leptorrhynchoides]|uniref:LOW QUALITY PROTEIN: putative FBD-associated F-box protein At1g61330 n=1 Tax=Rutidosis leptorrhynchoides TaxID=125765 RepID=UPI003A997FE7
MDCLQSSSTIPQIQVGISRQKPISYDFIGQMSYDVLTKILSLMPIKDAVATSGVATRWRYLWRNLMKLNFDGRSTTFNKPSVVKLENEKYINQVHSVIRSYNHPTVNDFRIRYGLNCNHKHDIDEWIQFAMNKKVEFLELDLTNRCHYMCSHGKDYDFPSRFADVLPYLKKLILIRVNVTQEVFEAFLKNSPHLEMIAILLPPYLYDIHVNGGQNGGQSRNLKHLQILDVCQFRSIYLSDLDNLVSFTFNSYSVDLHLAHLPKLKEVKLGLVSMNINNVFSQMSFGALSLQSLSLSVNHLEGYNILPESVPKLLNLKKLRLSYDGDGDDCLLYLAFMMNACPNLENFCLKPSWTSTTISKKKARCATNPHKNLKLVEIVEYKGRKCDYEVAAYIIQTAVELKKIVIAIERINPKKEEAARSSAERIKLIKPHGVELIII